MNAELLIDRQDIPHAHSMVLIAVHSTDRTVGAMTAILKAVGDTVWLEGTDSEFLIGTGRDGTWMLAYLPMGAVSDLLLSADLRRVPLTLEPINSAWSGIERAARRARRSAQHRVRAPQIWAEGVTFAVLLPLAAQEVIAIWCERITGLLLYNIKARQTTVNQVPIPRGLFDEWKELSTCSRTATGMVRVASCAPTHGRRPRGAGAAAQGAEEWQR